MSADQHTSAVQIKTMWIWVIGWWFADLVLHPLFVRWGLFSEVPIREVFREDFGVTWFVAGLWLLSSRKVKWN